jgi:SsrA-binding protein
LAKEHVPGRKVIARNRRASHDYFLDERIEAGLVLQGTEVKSLRAGRANINEAYASEQGGELYLVNATIPEYHAGNIFNHEPRRPRKLLLHKREMGKLIGAMRRSGETVIPTALYFNPRGIAKVELALARGKKAYDKRASIKERDWRREKERLIREKR